MPLTHAQLEERLAQIEEQVPSLILERNAFPRLFEEETEKLMVDVSEEHQDFALDQLYAIVQRSGYNL